MSEALARTPPRLVEVLAAQAICKRSETEEQYHEGRHRVMDELAAESPA